MIKPIKQISSFFDKPRPWLIFMTALLVYTSLLGAVLFRNKFDVTTFIHLGDVFSEAQAVPGSIQQNSYGFDGQFYYRIALDPFTDQKKGHGITLDQPALRHQRILYPLMVWLVSLGNSSAVPYVMIGINILALVGIVWASLRIAQQTERPDFWSLLLSLSPVYFISLSRDLTEIVAVFISLLAYLRFIEKKHLAASLFFSLAILARETILLIPLVLAVYYLVQALRSKQKNVLLTGVMYLIPIGVFIVWQSILFTIWHVVPFFIGGGLNLGFPFAGLSYALFYFQTAATKLRLFEIASLVTIGFLVLRNFKKSSLVAPLKYSWLVYLVLSLLYTKWIWVEDWTFLRALTEWYLLSGLILLYTSRKVEKIIFLSISVALMTLLLLKTIT